MSAYEHREHHGNALAARIADVVRRAEQPDAAFTSADAVASIEPRDLEQFLHTDFVESGDREILGVGIGASPGAASGEVVLSADAAIRAADSGRAVILVRRETTPGDAAGMQCARGIITARGGMASHAALVARGWGIPAVVGVAELDVREGEILVGQRIVRAGDWVSIDGSTGQVFLGRSAVTAATAPPELETLLDWADRIAAAHVVVRANADTATDARRARALGARGIGLCRTEHMFLAEDRLALMRRFILADDVDREHDALRELEQLQRADFEEILAVMDALPVTIRLLDPPLHEFLPDFEALVAAEATHRLSDDERCDLLAVRRLREVNPMMGTRGVRLGVMRPALYPMQVRAICRAIADRLAAGGRPLVEVLIPLVIDPSEMTVARTWVAAAVAASGLSDETLRVGTMVETPRAALLAGPLAGVSDFFSFGTNDLTQLTLGLSRDDVEMRLLPRYIAEGLLPANPFEVLDELGVGSLIRHACDAARAVQPSISIGACGEHAGDPQSIDVLVGCGIDSVSCSPSRVPIARLAVAQALLRRGRASPTTDFEARAAAPVDDDAVVQLRVLHALRIKGFSTTEAVAEAADVDAASAQGHLERLVADGLARFVAARSLWQLTAQGRDRHRALTPGIDDAELQELRGNYQEFLALNGSFKALCTEWQIRDGTPNDHLDARYDSELVARLAAHHERARHVLDRFAQAVPRLGGYGRRLGHACARTLAGDAKMFTGVMCGSYHDVWMELHEDLILLLEIDRTQEGSS